MHKRHKQLRNHNTFSNTAKELNTVEVGKLFDRFYTVDSARKSTGLGLSIAKLLTERGEYVSTINCLMEIALDGRFGKQNRKKKTVR